MRRFIVVAAVLVMLPVAGCRQAKEAAREQYYTALEKVGLEKREVLAKLQDQVLFLKHNLNAKVLGSLQTTAVSLETDVDALIRDMEASIREADAFIRDMEGAAK